MLRSPVAPPWMSKFCDAMLRLPPLTLRFAPSSRVTVHLPVFSDDPTKSSSFGHVAVAVVASILTAAA